MINQRSYLYCYNGLSGLLCDSLVSLDLGGGVNKWFPKTNSTSHLSLSCCFLSCSTCGSTTFIFIIIRINIPHLLPASFLSLSRPPLMFSLLSPRCLDLLVCSVYFSLSVGVRFGTSGISSSLLSFNPAVLPAGKEGPWVLAPDGLHT